MAIGPHTKVVDLEGKFVSPGLIDSHVHFISGGLQVCLRPNYTNVMRCVSEIGCSSKTARFSRFQSAALHLILNTSADFSRTDPCDSLLVEAHCCVSHGLQQCNHKVHVKSEAFNPH